MDENHKIVKDLTDDYWHSNRYLKVSTLLTTILIMIGFFVSFALMINNQNVIKQGIEETKNQSVINQKYIRCLALLDPSTFRGADQVGKAKILDDCATKSRLP